MLEILFLYSIYCLRQNATLFSIWVNSEQVSLSINHSKFNTSAIIEQIFLSHEKLMISARIQHFEQKKRTSFSHFFFKFPALTIVYRRVKGIEKVTILETCAFKSLIYSLFYQQPRCQMCLITRHENQLKVSLPKYIAGSIKPLT